MSIKKKHILNHKRLNRPSALCLALLVGMGGSVMAAVANGTPEMPVHMMPPVPLAQDDITARVPSHELPVRGEPVQLGPPGGSEKPPVRDNSLNKKVKVIDPDKVPFLQTKQIPPVFIWPDAEALRAENQLATVPVDKQDWDTDFAKWLSEFVTVRDPRLDCLKTYKENQMVSYCLVGEAAVVRLVWKPQDKTLRKPAQIQILIPQVYSREKTSELLVAIPGWRKDASFADSKLPLLAAVVDASPLSQKLKNATWELQGFGYDCIYGVVKMNLMVKNNDLPPLSLQVAIGPCGGLLVLSGIGLEKPEASIKDRRPPGT